MNLQVIISGDGWVLDRHGKLLADAFGGELRTEPKSMPADGITYLCNYAQVRKVDEQIHMSDEAAPRMYFGHIVSMLTHVENRDQIENNKFIAWWWLACGLSKALVPMSKAAADDIPSMYASKATVIPLPVPDYITKRRPRIGIAGIRNAANEYRKGWDLVDRLRADHPEWEIVTTGGGLSEPEMLAWYRSLDLYLCPSRYEGGPMGVIEAAAMGVPTIAGVGVGWCNYYADALFATCDYDLMVQCVDGMLPKCDNSTTDYIEAHRKLFASLL